MIKFKEPASYNISIVGRLSNEYSSYFAEMQVIEEKQFDGTIISTLKCSVKDQAELSAILNALYDWHFPILLVEYVE